MGVDVCASVELEVRKCGSPHIGWGLPACGREWKALDQAQALQPYQPA